MSKFTIHGARGTIPAPGKDFLKYGGNTTCFSLKTDQGIIVIDAGTGISALDRSIPKGNETPQITLLFTHFHLDHVIGLPVFHSLCNPNADITVMSDPDRLDDWQTTLKTIVSEPYWPVNLMNFGAHMRCRNLDHKKGILELYGARISWCRVWHPQQCLAYRIQTPECVIVIATDTEHGNAKFDALFLEFCQNADFLIYDAHYTPEEYIAHKGWGHSTWKEGVRIAHEAHVRKLILTHHDQNRHDDQVDDMINLARKFFPETYGAYEGMVLT